MSTDRHDLDRMLRYLLKEESQGGDAQRTESGSWLFGRDSVAEWASSGGRELADFAPSEQKYSIEAPLGRGGMGEVLLVSDQDLRRQVAMKVLRKEFNQSREQRLGFVAEAQATSQLEHPGIPPIHDIGVTDDGRVYFTMKVVRGRTLREILQDLLLRRPAVRREFTLHRLITIVHGLAETLHFAHERSVVHRDIKPENVMLGDYGEVHVMDWGLARVVDADADADVEETGDADRVSTATLDAGLETAHGLVKGTLRYMSPEQARGEIAALDRRTDIYALGCVLYEVLSLRSPFDGDGPDIFKQIQSGEYPPVEQRNPQRAVPVPLADACRRAMALKRDDRYGSAGAFAEALRSWLDGRAQRLRRRRDADALAERGRKAVAEYVRMRREQARAEEAVRAAEREYKPHQPVAEKRPLLDARGQARRLRVRVALGFAEAIKLLDGALLHEFDHATARESLAELWRSRLLDAERRQDEADAAYARAMIERYSDRPLAADAALSLASDPPGAEVTLYRYVEEEGVLVAREPRSLGSTPLEPVALPLGSYLCVLEKEGYRATRYPVHLARGSDWSGELKLRTDDEIGDDFVYVPGGPFIAGEGEASKLRDEPDFAIARYPVTFREYAAFLDSLDTDEARRRAPQTQLDGALLVPGAQGRHEPRADLFDEEYTRISRERHGDDFAWRLPVFSILWEDAAAYCAWKTKETGREWRLATEWEREKAARGVDGRRFAWGELEDASLGKCRDSRPETGQPEPVGAFPTAESVYGMADASGGVWDWTGSWLDEHETARVLRGGAWYGSPELLRLAYRYSLAPTYRFTSVGFRCARSL